MLSIQVPKTRTGAQQAQNENCCATRLRPATCGNSLSTGSFRDFQLDTEHGNWKGSINPGTNPRGGCSLSPFAGKAPGKELHGHAVHRFCVIAACQWMWPVAPESDRKPGGLDWI